jgi:hypothetical protein
MDGPKGLQTEKAAEGGPEDFVLICATPVGFMGLLELSDIAESVTYALSMRPIVGAPSMTGGWPLSDNRQNCGCPMSGFSVMGDGRPRRPAFDSPITFSTCQASRLSAFYISFPSQHSGCPILLGGLRKGHRSTRPVYDRRRQPSSTPPPTHAHSLSP